MTDFTGLTGKPPSPSPIGGHSPLSLLIAFALRRSTLLGYRWRMPSACARPIGYAYRLGLGGD